MKIRRALNYYFGGYEEIISKNPLVWLMEINFLRTDSEVHRHNPTKRDQWFKCNL